MTSSEIAGLREFISGELQKVHTDQLDFQQHVGTHFAKVYEGLNDVSSRLSRQETLSEEMRSDFRAFGEDLQSTNRKLGELRTEMDSGFRDVRTEMADGFRDVRVEMADGFKDVRVEMADGLEEVRTEMAGGFEAQGELIRSISNPLKIS